MNAPQQLRDLGQSLWLDNISRAQRPSLFIKIPGSPEGIAAIEEPIFAGVPINVTLPFTREHYIAAAEAYMRGIERRIAVLQFFGKFRGLSAW